MTTPGPRWRRLFAWTFGCCLGSAGLGYAQFTPFSDHTRAILEGNWQSCREADGEYAERIYDAKLPGIGPIELHMGPYHEFALFRGIQEPHRDHSSADNLLRPHNVPIVANSAHQEWDAEGLHLDVRLAGGSRDECESWFVTLRRLDTSSDSRQTRLSR